MILAHAARAAKLKGEKVRRHMHAVNQGLARLTSHLGSHTKRNKKKK